MKVNTNENTICCIKTCCEGENGNNRTRASGAEKLREGRVDSLRERCLG